MKAESKRRRGIVDAGLLTREALFRAMSGVCGMRRDERREGAMNDLGFAISNLSFEI
jgi:hypothetical protein